MKKIITLLALAIASTGSAMAAETPVYVGANVGYSHAYNIDASDRNGASGEVYTGYQVTPAGSIELGYTRLGDISDSGVTARPEMITLQAVGKKQALNAQTAVFVKGGVAYTRVRGDVRDSHYEPIVAIGAEYTLNKNVSAVAQMQYVHDFAGADVRVVNTSVGLKYNF